MVVAAHPLASLAGTEILLRGGNAVDAAVATAFALNVVEPGMSCVGGGGFMLVYNAQSQDVTALDYRERIAQKASPTMYEVVADQKSSEGWTLVKGNAHMVGHLAAAVPGEVAGLMYALEKHGTLPADVVMGPAIRFAEEGFPVYEALSKHMEANIEKLSKFPASRQIYLKDGKPFKEGEMFYQRELGWTLRQIAKRGAKGFYEGPVAEAIANEMKQNGGLISLEDLKYTMETRPRVMKPAQGTYRGYRIVSMSPPSSGGTHLIEMLNMLEHFDVKGLGCNTAKGIHLLSEVMKRAFADREKYMGDPDYVKVPVAGLTSKEYAAELASSISLDAITLSAKAGDPFKYQSGDDPGLKATDLKCQGKRDHLMGSGCTTHYSVVDRWGNMVSSTQTVNDGWGCGVVVPGVGVKLNDQMENTEPTPGKANSIEPGKAPLSSMSPTLVISPEGRPVLTVGAPGSARIFSTVLQIVVNMIDHGMNIEEALAAPRVFAPVDEIALEARVGEDVVRELRAMGHKVTVRGEWDGFFGAAHAVQVLPDSGFLLGVADPRRSGRPMGY
jgi:gamma-glutamyltranspeptidase/glutathione hydrolase